MKNLKERPLIERFNAIKCWNYAVPFTCASCPLHNTNYCYTRTEDLSDDELMDAISIWNKSFPDHQV